jgi:hypothetical protein
VKKIRQSLRLDLDAIALADHLDMAERIIPIVRAKVEIVQTYIF